MRLGVEYHTRAFVFGFVARVPVSRNGCSVLLSLQRAGI